MSGLEEACGEDQKATSGSEKIVGAGNAEEMYVEVVSGLGEALVGNWPGAAFSFTATKAPILAALPGEPEEGGPEGPPAGGLSLPEGCIRVCGYPSKSAALLLAADRGAGGAVTIFRSDSNGEDLEGCAPLALPLLRRTLLQGVSSGAHHVIILCTHIFL